ncbi:MAG: hypothetical protein RLZZ387_2102 [Chloroflexota bacterium]|jgi:hypothetical protein
MTKNRALLLGLGLLLAALIAATVRGAVRDTVVVPLLFLLWGTQLLLDSLPQALPWTLLVGLTLALAIGSLDDLRLPPARRRAAEGIPGRGTAWLRLFQLTERDEYSRYRLAQRLAHTALETLAAREGLSIAQARGRIEDPGLDAPPEVGAYLRAGLAAFQPRPGSRGRIVRGGPFDVPPERVIGWLESLAAPDQPPPERLSRPSNTERDR